MKKVHIFLTVAVMIATMGCGGGRKAGADGVMTLTTSAETVSIELMGSGKITVDWGDGSELETVELVYDDEGVFWLTRGFLGTSPRTITITGKNITGLNCSYQQLTELDVSQNIALTEINCEGNRLTALDVSRNSALTYLSCSDNQLTALDVSQNAVLKYMFCNNNQITALNAGKNSALINLACSGNRLTTLDVSQNILLEFLYCHINQLTALDVGKNTSLQELYCGDNQFTTEALNGLFGTLHNNDIPKAIDISNNPGSSDCDPSIAEAKGWTVDGFTGVMPFKITPFASGAMILGVENAVVEFTTYDVKREYLIEEDGLNHNAPLELKLPKITGNYNGINVINDFFANKEQDLYDYLVSSGAWELFITYSLETVIGRLISISGNLSGHAGGVGWHSIDGYVFDLNTGKQLTLSDIFNVEEARMLNFIYDYVSHQITESIRNNLDDWDGYIFNDAYSGNGYEAIRRFNHSNDFYLSEKALIIIYQKYELKSGAEGVQIFEIPYDLFVNN